MKIDPKDLRIDTFRRPEQGAFGLRTEDAVRITHVPSGLMVEEHEDRSVHKNKALAMTKLTALVEAWEPPWVDTIQIIKTPDKISLTHAQIREILTEYILLKMERGVETVELYIDGNKPKGENARAILTLKELK